MDNEGDNISESKSCISGEEMTTNNVNSTSEYKTAKNTKESDCPSLQYQKNASANQGVTGQLYEAKLNALILYRLQNNPKIKEFYMGSNLDGIGDMDDICVRLIHEECEKPILILIQAKHKDNPEAGILDKDFYIKTTSDFYLPKNFKSLQKLKEKFDTNVKGDAFYSGDLDDFSVYFIFYTPAVNKYLSPDNITTPKRANTHIDIVKDLISTRDGGNVFQKKYTDDDIEKLTKDNPSDGNKKLAKKFYDNLYFFSDQANQDDVGRELEKIIANNQVSNVPSPQLQVKPNAVFLNFYYEVFKWWFRQGKSYYLTKTNTFFQSALSYFMKDSYYLSMLSYICVNHLELYPIKFNNTSMNSSEKLIQSRIIISNSVILTSIKLKQYLQEQRTSFSYLDYSYVSKMSNAEFDILLSEIEKTNIKILVIICDTTQQVRNERLQNITSNFTKNIVIVPEEQRAIDLDSLHNINVEKDYIRGLVDISINDEHNIFEYKIIVQGKEMRLNNIIDTNDYHSMDIINAEILLTILKNEPLEVGRSLFYNKDDKTWFKRKVLYEKVLHSFDHLEDLNYNDSRVVVITAESGMGKSTLLSQLAAKEKTCDPKTWIVRINLQDYSKDFENWQDNNTEIGLKETMLLICKAELNAEIKETLKFDLQITNNRLEVTNAAIRGASLLLVKYIVHSFNEGSILYLFDGFDKMCPHYEQLVIKFIKNLTSATELNKFQVGPRVCITSRPYNKAKRALREFGPPLALAPLSTPQQEEFLESYWRANINKERINDSDKPDVVRQNITNFFNNISQNLRSTSIHLEVMYETARNYIRNEYNCKDLENIEINRSTYHPSEQLNKALHLSGIPLFMELYANHFTKHLLENVLIQNKGISGNSDIWRCDTFTFFKGLHDTEFEKVFYEGKNRRFPDARARCEGAKTTSNERHKKMAFYSLFHDIKDGEYYRKLPGLDNLPNEISKIIKNIRDCKEKIGFIASTRQDIPRFVHQTFAECYAVEFIADLLKSNAKQPVTEKKVIDFIINRLLDDNVGLMSVFHQKLKDDKDLFNQLSERNNKKNIFKVLMKQHRDKNSLLKVLDNGFEEIAKILIHSIETITDNHQIMRFVEFIKGDFFIYAASLNYKDLIDYVLNKIREVDSSMIKHISDAVTIELCKNSLKIDDNHLKTIVQKLSRQGIVNIEKINNTNEINSLCNLSAN